MFSSLIGERANIVVSSKAEPILEYIGTLESENEEAIVLTNADISYLMLNFQKGIFGGNLNRYKTGLEKVVINKKYIISCNK